MVYTLEHLLLRHESPRILKMHYLSCIFVFMLVLSVFYIVMSLPFGALAIGCSVILKCPGPEVIKLNSA